jgi:hypothetical protein
VSIAAVIPSLGERPELAELFRGLISEHINVAILGRPDEHNIHTIWNQGVKWVQEWDCEAIAILNDDIKLPANTLNTMLQQMKAGGFACVGVDPDPKTAFGILENIKTIEISGDGATLMTGITTWCFMVMSSAWVNIDEGYKWWFGVGDLFEKIAKSGGRLGQINGLGINHVGSGTAQKNDWTNKAVSEDRKLWRENHS